MRKTVINFLGIILFIFSLGCYIYYNEMKNNKTQEFEVVNSIKDKDNKKEVVNYEDKFKPISKDKQNNINNSVDKSNFGISNNQINNESNIDTNNNVVKKENKITKTVDKEKPIENNQNKEKPKKETIVNPWEELGITESDYYNKPMWKWAKVDFSIDEYKTIEKTKEACRKKGDEYFNQGLGYSCTSINSFSGNYLGEMIKTF